jgi:nodulation protein E
VITGLGIVSPVGLNAGDFWRSLKTGQSGIGAIQSMDTASLRFENAAEVKGFEPSKHFEGRTASQLDRFAQFAVVAARQAVDDAGIAQGFDIGHRAGVVTGTGIGGQTTNEDNTRAVSGRKRSHPLTVAKIMPNAGVAHISMEFGIRGPSFTFSTACSSSNHAIGHAFWLVRSGLLDLAISGGSEAPFCPGSFAAWAALRVVASDTCRPFCKTRTGMILGEGAGMLVLEDLESALSRGAPIYAEIVGFGMTADAHHITSPSVDGPAGAMRAAIEDGHFSREEVGYINAHGTGTLANDRMETAALYRVFGKRAKRIPISSTKSMHGHPLGAAGAFETVATAFALRDGILPPTMNFVAVDPECDIDVIPNEARAAEVEVALSNSFAFGGLNAVLAFRRWRE